MKNLADLQSAIQLTSMYIILFYINNFLKVCPPTNF